MTTKRCHLRSIIHELLRLVPQGAASTSPICTRTTSPSGTSGRMRMATWGRSTANSGVLAPRPDGRLSTRSTR
ncbi:hypothetical protein MJ575_23935 [Klebsiella pneumoniae]|nr:hypothetical protein MJ575_23935 [Klebsiella pneumoniae]